MKNWPTNLKVYSYMKCLTENKTLQWICICKKHFNSFWEWWKSELQGPLLLYNLDAFIKLCNLQISMNIYIHFCTIRRIFLDLWLFNHLSTYVIKQEREREINKIEINTHLFVKWNQQIKLGRFRQNIAIKVTRKHYIKT